MNFKQLDKCVCKQFTFSFTDLSLLPLVMKNELAMPGLIEVTCHLTRNAFPLCNLLCVIVQEITQIYVLLHRDTLSGNGKMEGGFTEVKIASYHRRSWSSFRHTVFFNETWVNKLCTLPRKLKVGHF